jgi:hypothetical protein
VFLPDDPRLRRHAAAVAEARRHSLAQRRAAPRAEGETPVDDEGQMSLFAVVGAVVAGDPADTADSSILGVFGPVGDAAEPADPHGVDLLLEPPPLPGGGVVGSWDEPVSQEVTDPRRRRLLLRELNAEVVVELVRATGWSHPAVNAELNRLAAIRQVSQATVEQLERRLECARRWLRSC